MRRPIGLLLLFLATSAHASDDPAARVFIKNEFIGNNDSCKGGLITGVKSIRRDGREENVESGLNLKRLQPGTYEFDFEIVTLERQGDMCREIPAGSPGGFRLDVRSGKTYEISLANDFQPQSTTLDTSPISMAVVSGLARVTRDRTLTLSSCFDLFPDSRASYIERFAASAFPAYADAFMLEVMESGFLNQERVDEILARQPEESRKLCDVLQSRHDESFTFMYGPWLDEVRVFMNGMLGNRNNVAPVEGDAVDPGVDPGKGARNWGSGKRTVEEFDAVVSENVHKIRRIHHRKLRVNPEFGGRVSFRLAIEDDGQVTHCEAVDTIDDDAEFSEQLCSVLSKLDFGHKADSGPGPYVYRIALNP